LKTWVVILLGSDGVTFSLHGDLKTSPPGGGITERASARHDLRETRARIRAPRFAAVGPAALAGF
jgi:hypothetical protein